jgi:hypothetical protein
VWNVTAISSPSSDAAAANSKLLFQLRGVGRLHACSLADWVYAPIEIELHREREREREKETERESVELTMSQRAANFRRVQRRTKKSEEAAENEGKYVAYENNVGEKLDIDL